MNRLQEPVNIPSLAQLSSRNTISRNRPLRQLYHDKEHKEKKVALDVESAALLKDCHDNTYNVRDVRCTNHINEKEIK